jgi:hypothetical protein
MTGMAYAVNALNNQSDDRHTIRSRLSPVGSRLQQLTLTALHRAVQPPSLRCVFHSSFSTGDQKEPGSQKSTHSHNSLRGCPL